MMSVLEYALDIKKTAAEVLAKCKELNIKVKSENDMLEEYDIVELDNIFQNSNDISEDTDEVKIDLEELDELISNVKLDDSVKMEKLKKKADIINNNEYALKKKEIYKNKEKLVAYAPTKQDNVVLYKDGMTVNEMAEILNVGPIELIKKLINLGVMANINTSLSFDDASLLVIDYDKELKKAETQDESNFEKLEIMEDAANLVTRPPVVTIMGHVDHGKTTLLDTIRKANVVSGEAGGITQHIGAYQITHEGKEITFIDTPGHAAFTEMRARGAMITDIVIIVVAWDDGLMPQTKEAIDHAKAAGVPILVAINKMDKNGANEEKVMRELAEYGLNPEVWGGDTIFVKVSALTGMGIPELLENILLVAEMAELKANPNRYAMGTVIEARLDKNVGPITTLLIQNGTLRIGDPIVVGTIYGKVRTLKNDNQVDIIEALPSTPVEITGLSEVPSAGHKFMAFETEKQARQVAETRFEKAKQKEASSRTTLSLDDLFAKIQEGIKDVNVILKADVKGSEEAVKQALLKISNEEVRINVIRTGTGTITESDVSLANASNAIIVGFNVRPSTKTMELAKDYNVDIRLHNIIYKVVEEFEDAIKGMLTPEYEEKVIGQAEVRKLFKFSKVGTIAGCYITDGIIKSNAKVRVIRDGVVIHDGNINAIQREQNTVKEIKQGFECGITLEKYNDLKEKDIIEAYEIVEVKK